MTAPSRVQRHRQADAARRRVRTTGVNRIGKRTTVPRRKPAARRRPKYQKSAALGALSGFFVVVCAATGSIFAAVGALTSAGAGVGVAYLEHRRDLIEVKATGKPIEDKPKPAPKAAAKSRPADEGARDSDGYYVWYCGNDCGTRVDYSGWICHECAAAGAPQPKPVDLDSPARGPLEAQWQAQQRETRRRAAPQQPARKPAGGKHGPPGHEAKCTAKTKEACPYWRKANPGRARKTTTKRATSARRKT